MEDSIFTKIIKGEVPGEMVYQDDQCVVLMTIEPVTQGHCLVIPREQIDHLWDVDDPLYLHLMTVAKSIAQALRSAYDYPRIAELVEGFGVPHAHIHILGLTDGFEKTMVNHAASKYFAKPDGLKREADKIRAHLA